MDTIHNATKCYLFAIQLTTLAKVISLIHDMRSMSDFVVRFKYEDKKNFFVIIQNVQTAPNATSCCLFAIQPTIVAKVILFSVEFKHQDI